MKTIIGGLVFFIGTGFFFEYAPWFTGWKMAMQGQSVPTNILKYGSMGRIMRDQGMIKIIPNDNKKFKPSKTAKINSGAGLFKKKRHIGKYLYAVQSPISMPRTVAT